MTVVKCENGHYFDSDESEFCPTCNAKSAQPPPAKQKEKKKGGQTSDLLRSRKAKEPKPTAQPTPKPPTPRKPVYKDDADHTQLMTPEEQAAMLQSIHGAQRQPQYTPPPSFPVQDSFEPEEVPVAVAEHSQEVPPGAQNISIHIPKAVPAPQPSPVTDVSKVEPMPEHPPDIHVEIKAARGTYVVEDDGVTQGIYHQMGTEPAVGWLVCIKGPHLGQDFKLISGRNHIGREPSMEVALIRDVAVSRVQHATVTFNQLKNEFLLTEGNPGRNPVYLNRDVFDGQQKLAARSVISLGESELMLIPFCNSHHNWTKYRK